ncbi:hypothetical protein M0R45_030956 [Rubus argutus]|uniref:Uncharacterized protein n=1 Tax=Rubus argutus TaxID=59490 RepID=A0AAW1WCH4_RUBAR
MSFLPCPSRHRQQPSRIPRVLSPSPPSFTSTQLRRHTALKAPRPPFPATQSRRPQKPSIDAVVSSIAQLRHRLTRKSPCFRHQVVTHEPSPHRALSLIETRRCNQNGVVTLISHLLSVTPTAQSPAKLHHASPIPPPSSLPLRCIPSVSLK